MNIMIEFVSFGVKIPRDKKIQPHSITTKNKRKLTLCRRSGNMKKSSGTPRLTAVEQDLLSMHCRGG